MKKTYFTINETAAKTANDLMSFHDYKPGRATEEYKKAVDKAYDLADRVAIKRPEEAERAYRLATRYSEKMAEYYNKEISIGLMCPSILVSGGSNFPTKKKERQIAAWNRNSEFYKNVQGICSKLEDILYGREIIKSDNEKAIEKLEEKLEDMKNTQERMKAANKAIRMKNLDDGNDILREMGYSELEINSLREPDLCGRIGYADYLLSNNNANIHRVESRLEHLKSVKGESTYEREYGSFTIVKNIEAMRYQIVFKDKPPSETRDILKRNGFVWAPSQKSWQRQITERGKNALEKVIGELLKMYNPYERKDIEKQ